tara:strand:- start:13146 stop:13316 length:171 start_codon:yes stop_codon:yes gene_type:complete
MKIIIDGVSMKLNSRKIEIPIEEDICDISIKKSISQLRKIEPGCIDQIKNEVYFLG